MVKRTKNDSSSCSPLKEVNGKLINDTYEKAEALNNQFQHIAQFISIQIFFKFTALSILKLLQDIKIHKAPAPEKLYPDCCTILYAFWLNH